MTALRKKMDPDMLDTLIFLKANRDLWPDARVIQLMINKLSEEETVEEQDEPEDNVEVNEFDI